MLPVTFTSAVASSVIVPISAFNIALAAVLDPLSTISSSSLTLTAPVELKVSEPNRSLLAALSPIVIAPPAPLAAKLALLVTVISAVASSVMVPVSAVSDALAPVLAPVITMSSSSLIAAAPTVLNVTEPNVSLLAALSPIVIAPPAPLAVKLILPVTLTSAVASSVIDPASATRTALGATLDPLRTIASSSLILTAPTELKVIEPNKSLLAAKSPIVITPPAPLAVKLALPVTVISAVASSVIVPVSAVSDALAPVLAPVITMSSSSLTLTAPDELKVIEPNRSLLAALSPIVIAPPAPLAAKLALPVTVISAVASSVIVPLSAVKTMLWRDVGSTDDH